MSCAREKTVEERYLYEGDKIVDVDTGDEYIMEESGEFMIVHPDGTTESINIEETPFFGTSLSDQYVKDWEVGMEERKEQLLMEKKMQLREERRNRYAHLSDEQLLKEFKAIHQKKGDMTLQREMINELVERGAVSPEEAPNFLEIDPKLMDLDVDVDRIK